MQWIREEDINYLFICTINFIALKIRADKNKPYSIYIVSTQETMMYILKNLNGLIRIKVPGFKEACNLYNIDYIEPNYNIGLYDPYFSGLVDTFALLRRA
jgi:hypothetical protein